MSVRGEVLENLVDLDIIVSHGSIWLDRIAGALRTNQDLDFVVDSLPESFCVYSAVVHLLCSIMLC